MLTSETFPDDHTFYPLVLKIFLFFSLSCMIFSILINTHEAMIYFSLSQKMLMGYQYKKIQKSKKDHNMILHMKI